MEQRTLTCIGCPMGCQITVELQDGIFKSATGFNCKIGKEYAKDEVTAPKRVVTSLIAIKGCKTPLSVKTASSIPKSLVEACLIEIAKTTVTLPVSIGDIIIKDVCNTGVSIVATRNIK